MLWRMDPTKDVNRAFFQSRDLPSWLLLDNNIQTESSVTPLMVTALPLAARYLSESGDSFTETTPNSLRLLSLKTVALAPESSNHQVESSFNISLSKGTNSGAQSLHWASFEHFCSGSSKNVETFGESTWTLAETGAHKSLPLLSSLLKLSSPINPNENVWETTSNGCGTETTSNGCGHKVWAKSLPRISEFSSRGSSSHKPQPTSSSSQFMSNGERIKLPTVFLFSPSAWPDPSACCLASGSACQLLFHQTWLACHSASVFQLWLVPCPNHHQESSWYHQSSLVCSSSFSFPFLPYPLPLLLPFPLTTFDSLALSLSLFVSCLSAVGWNMSKLWTLKTFQLGKINRTFRCAVLFATTLATFGTIRYSIYFPSVIPWHAIPFSLTTVNLRNILGIFLNWSQVTKHSLLLFPTTCCQSECLVVVTRSMVQHIRTNCLR